MAILTSKRTALATSTVLWTALAFSFAGNATAEDVAAKDAAAEKTEDLPDVDGYQQILPRGAIAALIDPDFAAADQAEMPDDAWILGFEYQGQAFAYDLNILNSHEIVNHEIAGRPFAAVW